MTLTGPDGAGAVPTISPSSVSLTSDPLPVVVGALAGAITAQRPPRSGRVGPLEDPVLPCREPAEDFRFACFWAGKPEVGFHSGQGIGGEACPLLDDQAHLVGPVKVVGGLGDQAEPGGVGCRKVAAGRGGSRCQSGIVAGEPDLQAGNTP